VTPQQFTEMFGPTEGDYEALADFAKANGLTVVRRCPNRVVLDVEGAVADIEKVLHVTMRVYQHPTESRTFYAPDIEPSVDTPVPVLHISGLDNYTRPHPRMHKVAVDHMKNAIPRSGSGPDGSYTGKDFRAAYAPRVTLNGSGQTLGLFELDGYYASDIAAYESTNGLPSVTLEKVLLDGFDGTPSTGPDSGNSEVALDIEMAISMAPGLSKVIVYEAGGAGGNPDDVLSEMANPTQGEGLPNQLSCSWAWGGGPDTTADQFFQQMVAQGQSFFSASGDSDAFVGDTSPQFPSDDPYITQVGGTTLTTTGPGGSYVSESVWNSGRIPREGYLGSSGGISTIYSIPSWQQGISMSANQGSTTMRNIPDVAMVAYNVSIIADDGQQETVLGTSCATPLWAGFVALANQQTAANGQSRVGFINPGIYAIGQGANYTSEFHDITTGNNEWPQSPDQFVAVAGYDLCTGWGSPTGSSLIGALAGTVHADLSVGQANSPDPAVAGEDLTYTITVINNGPAPATSVTVTDTLPARVTFVSAVSSQGTSTYAGGVVSCALGSLADAATASIQITVIPTIAGAITNTITVGANQVDPNLANNTSTMLTTVLTPPQLGVSPSSYNFGTETTGTTALATFVVTNEGEATLTGTATVGGEPFAVLWGNSLRVPGGDSAVVVVGFTPSSVVDYTDSVQFASNGGSSTNLLIGTGTTNAPSGTTSPTLIVLSPADYQVFTNAAATVTGLVSDPSGINSVTINGAAAAVAGTDWSADLRLSTGTNTLTVVATDNSPNMNTATQIVHAVFWRTPADAAPVILSTPVVTNAVLQVGYVAVVEAGETNTFAVNAVDPAGGLLTYLWSFGDGAVSGWLATNIATHAYASECGSFSTSVTVSNGQATASRDLNVAVACPLIVSKIQLKANFRKADADSCTLKAALDLGAGFNLVSQLVTVDVGGGQAQFNLNSNGDGHGVGLNGTCKFSYNKHTALWTATVDMKDGSWQTAWAAYGMTNSTIRAPGVLVTNVPVVVVIGDEAFMGSADLRYKSKAGQSGTAK
jgi:uncharacterized repeat protein (TIGR01451 family)